MIYNKKIYLYNSLFCEQTVSKKITQRENNKIIEKTETLLKGKAIVTDNKRSSGTSWLSYEQYVIRCFLFEQKPLKFTRGSLKANKYIVLSIEVVLKKI